MLKIAVRLHGQTIQVLELSDPATIYWAGRSENCQIPLKVETGISRQHFKIQLKEGLWQMEVVSPYGKVQVGENALRELVLQEGVSFSLPPYEFKIESELNQAAEARGALVAGSDVSGGEENTVTRFVDKSKQFILAYKDPHTKETKFFPLTKNSYLVGRDKSCDIILDDARVSRRQFKISNNNDKFYLVDNQGVNSTYINKVKVTSKEPVLIQSGDRITVINHHFLFEIRDAEFESKLQKAKHLALVDPMLTPSFPSAEESAPADLGAGAMNSPPISGVKVLNFWGFKIPLNKQNKIRLGLVGFLLVAIIAGTSEEGTDLDSDQDVASRPSDPFSKLTPEEQKQVKVQYELAKDLYTKGNYQLAKEELSKVHAKVSSYLDSEELARFIEVGIQSAQEREQQERLKREAAEAEERIQNIVAFCKQQLKPDASVAESDECLAPAIQLNPEHELLVKVREEIARLEETKKMQEAEKNLRDAQAAELAKQYKLAYDLGQKDPLKGKHAFEEFLKLTMFDPDKLQDKARKDIKRLERQIKAHVDKAISSVRSLVEAGKHKEAIISLEKAVEMSPEADSLQEEIDRITEELRKKMQVLYQEAILEENIGNVDTAKDRWRKIINLDVPNGEYYSKAKTKLKKYGGS